MEQEIVSGSGISWAICKSAPRPRQITMPAPHHSVYYRHALPAAQPTASKHWRQRFNIDKIHENTQNTQNHFMAIVLAKLCQLALQSEELQILLEQSLIVCSACLCFWRQLGQPNNVNTLAFSSAVIYRLWTTTYKIHGRLHMPIGC